MDRQLKDDFLRTTVFNEFAQEQLRGVPVKCQKTITGALQDAEDFKNAAISQQCQIAAKALELIGCSC